MRTRSRRANWLRNRAKLGDRGFPPATVAVYGPDERRATKGVAAIFQGVGREASDRWTGEVEGLP